MGFGVYGQHSSGTTGAGVYAVSTATDGNGILAEANNGTEAFAIWGKSTNGEAGHFTGRVVINGDLEILGTISKDAGSFKIDHPLDPANKYLYHSFVESPDMMNIYNGNVTLDGRGEATGGAILEPRDVLEDERRALRDQPGLAVEIVRVHRHDRDPRRAEAPRDVLEADVARQLDRRRIVREILTKVRGAGRRSAGSNVLVIAVEHDDDGELRAARRRRDGRADARGGRGVIDHRAHARRRAAELRGAERIRRRNAAGPDGLPHRLGSNRQVERRIDEYKLRTA
jgi:hypothetical protein